MITKTRSGERRLNIFQEFIVDRCLPKYKKESKSSGFNTMEGGSMASWNGSLNSVMVNDAHFGAMGFMESLSYSNGFIDMLMYKFLRFIRFHKIAGSKKKSVSVSTDKLQEFFDKIKAAKTTLELKDPEGMIESYELAITQAKELGQEALVETLMDNKSLMLSETKLKESGYDQYLTEEQLIEFFVLTEESKNLKLLWIKNFVRVIPADVFKSKVELDALGIFDNYVILTFDPLNQMGKMTKKEIEKAKDPILFGVIEGSNRLYFVADWEDEYCNLKLSDVIDTLGTDINSLGNDTVRIYSTKRNEEATF